ncbi:MAG: hypothetical protein Q8O13_04935 [Candidatus Omnitrophota bacterium]|nr:hypothetical protein [Candidatus Omnitrophota bacterium]
MKKAIILLIVCLLGISLSYAENKPFQIRLVLTKEEAKNIPHDVYAYQLNKSKLPQKLLVSKEVALANEDIKEVYIIRAENRYKQYPEVYRARAEDGIKTLKINKEERKKMYSNPEIRILFTDMGVKKLEEFSKRNLKRKCAIVFDGKVLSSPVMMEPLTAGAISIDSYDITNDKAAKKIVRQLGFKPRFLYE